MTRSRRRAQAPGRRRLVVGRTAVAAWALAAVLSGCGADGAPAVTAAEVSPPSSDAGVAVTATPGVRAGVSPERPVGLVLPSGRPVTVRPVSTTGDGTLAVPGDIDVAGWWRGGSRIGDPFGSVLLAAHVDSTTQGLGPFAELLSVRAGQPLVLTSAHLRQAYVVSELRLLERGPLSEHPWVYAPDGPHRLTLVTCAGPYVPSLGGYQQLAVVTATAVGEPVAEAA